MTVSEIVKDLLEHNMITFEAATVLLNAESRANLFNNQTTKVNQLLQPYHQVIGTTNPYYINTNTTGLNDNANELLKAK